MSLQEKIINTLLTDHPQACQLLVKLMQAIDLQLRRESEYEEVNNLCLSELDGLISATIQNLSISDATPVEADHGFRVLHTLFIHLQTMGVFWSLQSEEKIEV